MKTSYKPIAMRCIQEQFDSIKDLIPLRIEYIASFTHNNYLINNFEGKRIVTNVSIGSTPIFEGEVIEVFDGKYFLECCGEYVSEQTWKGSDLQYKRIDNNGNDWFDCLDYLEYRVKPKPNLDADIEALQSKAKELGINLTILIE